MRSAKRRFTFDLPKSRFTDNGGFAAYLSPPVLLALSFAFFIFLGAVLLMLPYCVAKGQSSLPAVDALFISTSAVCVTGLVPVDIGSRLSAFGQVVVLFLFQIGGMGFLTVATGVLYGFHRRSPLNVRQAVADSMTGGNEGPKFSSTVRSVILFTLSIEAIGAVILSVLFARDQECSWSQAAWLGVFHSVSAFCNAGFSLFPDSLCRFAADGLFVSTVSLLVFCGGLGFVVLDDLRCWQANRRHRLSLHSKIVLSTTLVLIVGGSLLFAVLEYGRGPVGDGFGRVFWSSLFQAVTARTAGFNTVGIEGLSAPTLMLLIALMFIGGGPASCAGGIKTTTAFIWWRLALARWQRRLHPTAFGREIESNTVGRAVTLSFLALFFILVVCALVMFMEADRTWTARSGSGSFMDLLFESVSAFGTVGLSTGVTGLLSAGSKLVLVVAMFVGRLGPLTVFLRLSQTPREDKVRYPREAVMVG